MPTFRVSPKFRPWLAFLVALAAFMALGLASAVWSAPVSAQDGEATPTPAAEAVYGGPEFCATCHGEIHVQWSTTRHAAAFSSPIFQQNWSELGSQFTCLECHTTGYDSTEATYTAEGVTCEACHGPFQLGHPERPMPIEPDAALCSTCHKTTTDEWRASKHGEVGLQCQSCHNPHTQKPKAETITALCSNCHAEPGQGFAHSTHADAGLECSNCHMYRSADAGPAIGGLLATGHTFTVGSEACIGCHQDTVHTRDTILSLTGDQPAAAEVDPQALQQQVQDQAAQIETLEASSSVRLYVGLAQGAIVGLIVGGVAAWIVSRRLRVVVEEGGE
jgi:predicted CXXCH cytochrome family protein